MSERSTLRALSGWCRTLVAPIAAVEYLEPALAFASDDKIQVGVRQFDLANVPASSIYFFGDQRRPFESPSGPGKW